MSFNRRELLRRAAASGLVLALDPAHLVETAGAASEEPAKVHDFVSRPDLRPPVVSVTTRKPGVTDGHLFLAPSSGPGQRGALMIDNSGEPIWFRNSRPVVAMNFRAAVYRGKPVLSWWEGKTEQGLGDGTHIVLDDTYREIARIPAGGGRPSDLHEFIITERGTALVTAWERVTMDLTSLGGEPDGVVVGGIVQEIELPSGRVLFSWHSLDHVDISESYVGVSDRAPFDYFHVNSIELDRDGNYLISARHTWTIYKIDRDTGKVLWRLGGKKSDFQMGPDSGFAWQHDARRHGGGEYLISVFDDGDAGSHQSQPYSKGLILALDLKRMQATVHRKYVHEPHLLAHALGSVQVFPNSNVLVGWGTSPYMTEYTAHGDVVFDAHLPHGGENYRALRLPWVGRPAEPPTLVYQLRQGVRLVFASWNGATEVAHWRLDTGLRAAALTPALHVPRSGFETQIVVPDNGVKYAAAVALDRHGKPLGTSRVIRV